MRGSKSQLVDRLVGSLFESAKLDPKDFKEKIKQASTRPTFDAYIQPFVANQEEKQIRTGLSTIVQTNLDPTSQIVSLPLENQLISVLKLEVPKRVIEYVAPTGPVSRISSAGGDAAGGGKAKQPRAKGFRAQSRQSLKGKRDQPEIASLYVQDTTNASTTAAGTFSADASPPPTKRARFSRGGGSHEDQDALASSSNLTAPSDDYKPAVRQTLPQNFYQIADQIFNEFWDLEIDDEEVSPAFFANITSINCKLYKLEAFSEQSHALPVIKVIVPDGNLAGTLAFFFI